MLRAWARAISCAWVMISCGSEPTVQERPVPEPSPSVPLPVAVAGCRGLTTHPTCFRLPKETQPLTLWLDGEWQHDLFSVTGEPSATKPETGSNVDGTWIKFHEPVKRVVVTYPNYQPFVLEIETLSQQYAEARENPSMEGRLADAREDFMLRCHRAKLNSPTPETLHALEAEPHDEIRCIPQLALVLLSKGTEPSDLYLQRARDHDPLDLHTHINFEIHAAKLAQDIGLLGDARRRLARAARLASITERAPEQSNALMEQALLLGRVGRFEDAAALAEQAVALSSGAFALEIRFNKAWFDVMRRAQDLTVPDPAPELRELIEEFTDDERIAVARLNLAVAIMQTGDYEDAARELALVEQEAIDSLRQQLYYELTSFRIALAAGDPKAARTRLGSAESLAEAIYDREFSLELLDARAELELQAGDRVAALDAFKRAETLADTLAMQVPANAGRSSYWTTLTRSRARHIELALESGDVERALCTILGVRTRHLRSLATGLEQSSQNDGEYVEWLKKYRIKQREVEARLRNSWKASKQQKQLFVTVDNPRDRQLLDQMLEQAMALRERQPPAWHCADARSASSTSALLTAYPSADKAGWWFLLDRERKVAWTYATDDDDGASVATRALEHFAAQGQLGGVEDLTVIPLGKLLAVNFQTLGPVVQSGIRVRHGLGLGNADATSSNVESAALVSDPLTNLPQVQVEIDEVRKLLDERGWRVEASWDPEATEQPRFLHFAGHAEHTNDGGWDSYLLLPGDHKLTAEQLLLGGHAPSLVVLSACVAGASDPTMLDGGMNVAVALLFAGARLVIAADTKVADTDSRALARALHAALPDTTKVDVDAMVAALAKLQLEDPRFRSWRAWVP